MASNSWFARLPAGVLGAAFVLLWSTGYPAARVALDHAAPFTVLVLRFACAGLIYAALAVVRRAAWPRGRAALHTAVVGLLQLALQFGALYLAASRGVNVGLLALVIGTMPIVTAILGLAFGEAVRPLQWLGFVFGFGGVALAVGQGIGPGHGAGTAAYVAVVVGLLAVSTGTLYQKRFGSQVDLRTGLALQHLVAASALVPFAAYEGWAAEPAAALFGSLAWMIAVNSMGAFALLFVLLRRGAVNQVAALFFLMPPVTALVDYLVLGDRLSVLKVSGIAAAAFGVYLATRPAGTQPRRSARRVRQLPAHAESPVDEEAPQLLTAVDPGHAVLRHARDRASTMREQAVEGLDRRDHGGDLALAPALVGAQHTQRSRILARRHRCEDELRQRRGIEEPEIDALSGKRMHDVRRIADERDAVRDVARC